MKVVTVLVLLLSSLPLFSQLVSPNKKYAIVYLDAPSYEVDVNYVRTSDRKTLFQTFTSGVGGHRFEEIAWSADSTLLAVAVRGLQTMIEIGIYRFDAKSVTKVSIPEYQLNLLGRHHQTEGGRYSFAKGITWNGNTITFTSEGNLAKGVSNPKDQPNDWYKYQVSLKIVGETARLSKVTDLKPK